MSRENLHGLLITLLCLLLLLLVRASSGQQFYDEDVPSLRCCSDEICCERDEANWENSKVSEPEPTPFQVPWIFEPSDATQE